MTGPGIVLVEWRGEAVGILDQRELLHREVMLECRTVDDVVQAIRSLAVRGAEHRRGRRVRDGARRDRLDAGAHEGAPGGARGAAAALGAARPTAVNLSWAVDRMMAVATGQCCQVGSTMQRVHEEMVAEALEDRGGGP